ncbi:MAG: hypothetical protein ACJAT1_000391 [Marivirga sp.]|jgi:hypothetical protein
MKKYLSIIAFLLLGSWNYVYGQACLAGEEKLVIEVSANGNFGAGAFSWTLTDGNGDVVFGYNLGEYTKDTITLDSICLTTGANYTFEAFSEFGDAWNDGGNSTVSIYYADDEIPLYFDSPTNGNLKAGEPEVSLTFTVGERLGLDCTQAKAIDIYNPELLITNAFNTNADYTNLDSGKDIILSFTAPSNDNYQFSVYDVATPTNVSLQLLTDCTDGAPSTLGSGQSSISQEPFSFGAILSAGATYYLLFSNDALASGGTDTAQARLEITYNTVPLADNCNSQTVTMDGASFISRFANATSSGSQIALNTNEGLFFQADNIDINFDFNVLDTNLVVEVSNYPKNAELFAQISFGGCPSGSTNYRNVTFEGTTRRIDFNLNPAEFGGTASLRLAPGLGNAVNTPFTIKVRSRANVLSEFPVNTNNDCSTAASVGVNTLNNYFAGVYPKGVQLSNYNATNSGLAAPCSQDSIYTGTTGDVWVKVMVPETGIMAIKVEGEYVDVSNTSPLKIAWALYRGTCGSLTEYYCPTTVESYQADSVGGLTNREEVYIRLFDRGGLREGDFSVKIQEVEKLTVPQVDFLPYPDSILLTFNTLDFIFDDFLLDVSLDSFNTFLPTYQNVVLNKNTSQFSITNLSPNQKYYFRLKKRSSNLGDSEYLFNVVKTNPYQINTIASGNWNDPVIWQGGVVPAPDSAVNILHRVVVPSGLNVTIEAVTISHTELTVNTIGLFIEDANFTVKRDIDVVEFGEIQDIDTLGVFVSNNSGLSKVLSVEGNVNLMATSNFATQFMFYAQNFAGNLSVNVGKEFLFNSSNTYSFAETEYSENILFENINFGAKSLVINHNDGISLDRQSFKAKIDSSNMTIANDFSLIESTFDKSTIKTFEILFTGNSTLDLKGSFYKESGGVLKFIENSTLILSGIQEQYFDVFDPVWEQDSTILNNLIINNTFTGNADRAQSFVNLPSISFTAGLVGTGTGQVLINGQISLLNGVATTLNGLDDKSVSFIVSENGTVDPAYDGSSNSYFIGYFTKYGIDDFVFPIGSELGPRVLGVSNFTATLPNSSITIGALSNACKDSTFNVAAGIVNARVDDYWAIETVLQEPSVSADFTSYFTDLIKEGINNTTSLRLLDFGDGIDLGNNASLINFFIANYNFDNGLIKTFGIGSTDNLNTFYQSKTVTSISSVDVVAGDNIVFTYSGNYASVSDRVYFEQIQGNTLSATANSITVQVPLGARSGEPVIVLENNDVVQLASMVNVRESNLKPIVAQQYDSLVLIDNIGVASFGDSKLQVSDINSNSDFDVIAIKQESDSIYFVKDLAGAQSSDFYYHSELRAGEKLSYKDINVSISNAFGTPSVDIGGYVQLFEQQIQFYLYNDGIGNFGIAETEPLGPVPKIKSPFIRDLNGDGFSDFNFSLETSDINFNGIYTTAFDSDLSCNPYVLNPLYDRGDKNIIKEIAYGNFGELGQTLYYVYVPNSGELLLQDPSLPTNNTVASLSAVSSSLTDFHKAAINRTDKAQFLAIDTVVNTIEIYDGFTNGSIINTSVPLAFSPGRMAIEDLNGDGYVDIVVSERNSPNLYFYQNDTAGNFSLIDSKIGITPNIIDLEIVDANRDGDRDLIIFFENGDISVAYFNSLLIPSSPVVVASNISISSFDLNWASVEGASEYQITVSLSSDSTANLATDSVYTILDTLVSFNAPTKFATYYVFARSMNLAGDTSAYAVPVQVDLLPLVVPPAVVASNITTSSFDLEWLAVSGASNYAIEVSLSSDSAANLITDSVFTLSDTLVSFNAPTKFATYYVFARSINQEGDTSLYSVPVQVDLLPLVNPLVSASAPDANHIDFVLTAVEGADSYELFISLDSSLVVNAPTDTLLAVASGITQYVVPEYSEMYYIYARSIANSIDTTAFAYVSSLKLPVSSYLAQDSLALVSLYQNNNGVNWTDQAGWLTEKVNKWYGLEMIGDTIVAIFLSSNNLKGSLVDSIALMNHLQTIDLSNNELFSLGNIASLEGQLVNVDVANNLLNFEELEKLSAVPSYSYLNQSYQYDLVKDTIINLNESIVFSPAVSATSNIYQWYKDGSAISGEISGSLSLNNVTKINEGVYHLVVTNAALVGLTFYTDSVDFKVSTLERDVAALKALYSTTNGATWTGITWDTTQLNPADWNASGTDIVVENSRVVEVRLPNNNLSGNISPIISQMLGLRAIDFSGNNIEGLPKLSSLPNLTSLNMEGNKLGYEDLEPNVNITGFSFANQQLLGEPISIEQEAGSSYTTQFDFAGTANTYQWYRNDQIINGAITDSIQIDSLVFANTGEYYLAVANNIINAKYPGFKLSSALTSLYATAQVAGLVTDANGFATTAGKLSLFEITSNGSYDTVLFQNNTPDLDLNSDGTYTISNVRLGDYILLVKPNKAQYPNLLPTYYAQTIDWDLATTLSLRGNSNDVNIIMEGTPQALAGTSVFSGYLEEEYEESVNGRALPRRRVGGAGVSVRRIGNSNKGISVFNGELVAYTITDENGEFMIPNLPAGDFISKIDYPGIPMNESSDIRFSLTGENLESLQVVAIVDNGVCTMETVLYTAVGEAFNVEIIIYPNPFSDKINLTGDLQFLKQVRLFDGKGQLIKLLKESDLSADHSIDLNDIPAGMYILNLDWQNGLSSSSKIIKK